ncbi:MAG: hypothetical protein [Microviridae sp.]|nr:MAG: hypothetical protein [Microviridae sp.]
MYKKNPIQQTSIERNTSYEAVTIEGKVRRMLSNKEPIKDGAQLIYTERKDGVLPSYNIRTDRWEVAVEAMSGVSKAHITKREERAKIIKMDDKKEDGKPDSIQGTDNTAEKQ